MKPAPFVLTAARTLDEALGVLTEHGDGAKVLAGGQSLVPMMNLRLAAPEHVVDITGVREVQGLGHGEGHVEVRAGVRQAEAEDAPEVRREVPLLHEALGEVAHREIRNAGTVCGSAAHGDAAAEVPAVSVALDAEMVVAGPGGVRTVAARDFFRSYLTTALAPDEILIAVRFPVAGPGDGSAFLELARRRGDYAIAGVAARVTLRDGRIASAALGLLGVDTRPVRAAGAEAALAGAEPTPEALAHAGTLVSRDLDPAGDLHASAAFRRHVAGVLAERALGTAVRRARGEDPTSEEEEA
jgi:carbon-monoxide dehydrogenase medium subunit